MKEESKITSASSGEIVVVGDDGERYSVLLKKKDAESGKITERKASISHSAFESGVKSGLLQKK